MKYWNIHEILCYNRNFNFINGPRSVGKTYGTLKWCLHKSIKDGKEFVYLVRTQDEKKQGILSAAFQKVITNEDWPCSFEFDNSVMTTEEGQILGHCIALSEYMKIKKKSYPAVHHLIFDEYMIENAFGYVSGWKEPDLFLSIYHTIDREEDRLRCFLLGNNTMFFNPYHTHPAFSIPEIDEGEIWTGKNVLFQRVKTTAELKSEKQQSRFIQMIEKTEYANYALEGNYRDNTDFISDRSKNSKLIFVIYHNNEYFGVWNDPYAGVAYISTRHDKYSKFIYCFDKEEQKEGMMLVTSKNSSLLQWLGNKVKLGQCLYESMSIKNKIDRIIRFIL